MLLVFFSLLSSPPFSSPITHSPTTLFLILLLGFTGRLFPCLVSASPSHFTAPFTVPSGKRSAQQAGRPLNVPLIGSHSTWRVRSTELGSEISRVEEVDVDSSVGRVLSVMRGDRGGGGGGWEGCARRNFRGGGGSAHYEQHQLNYRILSPSGSSFFYLLPHPPPWYWARSPPQQQPYPYQNYYGLSAYNSICDPKHLGSVG